jgi:hAT family C-terminal dimerisation region
MDGSIADVLPAMSKLLTHLEDERKRLVKRGGCATLVEGIDAAWTKLNKYYTITDDCPVYLVAVVCDPRRNMAWIRWAFKDKPDWIATAEDQLREFFESYRDKSADRLIDDVNTMTFASWPNNETASARCGKSGRIQGDAEYREYISLSPIPLNADPMAWWGENFYRFPTWRRIAYDVLPIPAMSAENERAFSRFTPLC